MKRKTNVERKQLQGKKGRGEVPILNTLGSNMRPSTHILVLKASFLRVFSTSFYGDMKSGYYTGIVDNLALMKAR